MRLLLSFLLLASLTASGDIKCVGPSATGSGSGADWNNIAAWSAPARGVTNYLQDGAYTSVAMNTAESGTTLCVVKKAIESDHGTDTGWSSAFGDGQAAFTGQWDFTSDYWLIDGQTGGGPGSWTNGFGIKITETADEDAVICTDCATHSAANNVRNLTLRHIELEGKGSPSGQGGQFSNDGFAFYGGGDITISYAYVHGTGRCPWFSSCENLTNEFVYVGPYFSIPDPDGVHSEILAGWQFAGSSIGNYTYRWCMFTVVRSTGGLMLANDSDHSKGMDVYGCVFVKEGEWVELGGNGVIGSWSVSHFWNVKVRNCTFINIDEPVIFGTLSADFGSNDARNNLLYNVADVGFGSIWTTHDYQHYVDTTPVAESNDTTASGNPFISTTFSSVDFAKLSADTPAGDTSIAAIYRTDWFGNVGSTRGAVQFTEPARTRLVVGTLRVNRLIQVP